MYKSTAFNFLSPSLPPTLPFFFFFFFSRLPLSLPSSLPPFRSRCICLTFACFCGLYSYSYHENTWSGRTYIHRYAKYDKPHHKLSYHTACSCSILAHVRTSMYTLHVPLHELISYFLCPVRHNIHVIMLCVCVLLDAPEFVRVLV